MKGYLAYCYCRQDSEKFEKLDGKTYPTFRKDTYSVCHREIREKIQVKYSLFLRTNWRGCPYIVGYYEINEKNSNLGPILVAKNRLGIAFNLPIDAEILGYLKLGLKIAYLKKSHGQCMWTMP